MRTLRLALVVVSAAAVIGLATSDARADDDPPKYERKEVTGPQYTAPLAQQTQPSYVPQSIALSGPLQIDDWNGRVAPPGYTPVEKHRRGMLVAGACVFGTLYFFSAYAASLDSGTTALAVPVFGPFIQVVSNGSSDSNGLLIVDGIGQAVGAILMIAGLTTTKTVLVRNDIAEVRIAPVATKQGSAFGLVGTF